MVTLETFEQFMATSPGNLSVSSLILALFLAAVLSIILTKVYVRFGTSISNREQFSKNFLLLTLVTTLIITVVKSSLALSLGLVGALSIVRFRAAIKEPEELSYLFFSIAIGLGLGANQIKVTLISFMVISLFIFINYKFFISKKQSSNIVIKLTDVKSDHSRLKKMSRIISKHCSFVKLKRYGSSESSEEYIFYTTIPNLNELSRLEEELKSLSKSLTLSYFDDE